MADTSGRSLRTWMRGTTVALGLLGLIATAMPTAATAQGPGRCANASEAQAFRVRSLQNHFMVAALSCNQREQYNAFVGRFHSLLSSNGRTIKRYFQGAWGARGGRQLDDYVTLLANRVSVQSLTDRGAFCQAAATMMQHVMTLDDTGLRAYSATLSDEASKAPNICL